MKFGGKKVILESNSFEVVIPVCNFFAGANLNNEFVHPPSICNATLTVDDERIS